MGVGVGGEEGEENAEQRVGFPTRLAWDWEAMTKEGRGSRIENELSEVGNRGRTRAKRARTSASGK
jgi:hypothetical protein